jgi:hypothetical protein
MTNNSIKCSLDFSVQKKKIDFAEYAQVHLTEQKII